MDDARCEIDAHVSKTDDRRFVVGRAATQQRAGTRQQLADAERLRQVIVGAGVERRDLVVFLGTCRQHQNRDRRPAAQIADHVDAFAIGQAEIEHDQVWPPFAGAQQSGGPVGGLIDGAAFVLQRAANEATDRRLVLDDENTRQSHACPTGDGSATIAGGLPFGSVNAKHADPSAVSSTAIVPS